MSTHVFTSLAANYLPKGRVMARSLKRLHPDFVLHLALVDAVPPGFRMEEEPFDHLMSLAGLGIEDHGPWLFKHSVMEACTAVKGIALLKLLAIPGCSRVLFFDPDIVVLSRLDELIREFDSASILLTPHLTQPEQTTELIVENEVSVLKYGMYNLGFLGVKNSAEGRRFAQWWAERLESFCYAEPADGLFTDQRWADHVPAFFDEVRILRSPVYNVSSWNLTHRTVEGDLQGGLTIDGRPIVFYHFSGLDRGSHQDALNRLAPRMRGVYELQDWYLAECDRMGQRELGATPWSHGFFDNGQFVEWRHYKRYRESPELQAAFPNPYSTADVRSSYYDWFSANVDRREKSPETAPTQAGDGQLSRELTEARERIRDLENSWSWRVSAPLRVLGGWLKRLGAR